MQMVALSNNYILDIRKMLSRLKLEWPTNVAWLLWASMVRNSNWTYSRSPEMTSFGQLIICNKQTLDGFSSHKIYHALSYHLPRGWWCWYYVVWNHLVLWFGEQTQWTLHTSAPPSCYQQASTGSTPPVKRKVALNKSVWATFKAQFSQTSPFSTRSDSITITPHSLS